MSVAPVRLHVVDAASEAGAKSCATLEMGDAPNFAIRATRCETAVAQVLSGLLDENTSLGKKRLAAALGISLRSLEYLIAEEVKPSVTTLYAIADYVRQRGDWKLAAALCGFDVRAAMAREIEREGLRLAFVLLRRTADQEGVEAAT